MKEKLKVLVLFNCDSRPAPDQDFSKWIDDDKNEDWAPEREVIKSLTRLGHDVKTLGLFDDINILGNRLKANQVDVVFNLTEHFNGQDRYDANIAGVLEVMGVPFTGAGSIALMLCRNKSVSKKLLAFHRIKVPRFVVFERGKLVRWPKPMKFPLLVKPLTKDASEGIAQSSFTDNDKDLRERVHYIHDSLATDVIAEEYIDGRELYVSVIGKERLTVLPVREMKFGLTPEDAPRVATYKAKWDREYRKRWQLTNVFAGKLPDGVEEELESICKKAYRVLMLEGYARFDFRLSENKEPFLIEANPNPLLTTDDEIAQSAAKADIPYDELIRKILSLALQKKE